MQLFSGCGFCEKCVILASMAGAVQQVVAHNEPDSNDQFIQELSGGSSMVEGQKFMYKNVDEQMEEDENEFTEPKTRNVQTKRDFGDKGNEPTAVESWCVIWYLGAFGCLVCFFLVITCTELFFGNPLYRSENLNSFVQNMMSNEHKSYVPQTPPPPYHLFAPPDYEETVRKVVAQKRESLNVFVVPVHTHSHSHSQQSSYSKLPALPAPPAYENVVGKVVVNDKFVVVHVPEVDCAAVA